MQKSYMANKKNIEQKCYLVDAKDKVLGRVATKVANILRGKHKAVYTPYVDTGDMVVVINADKIRVTGNKLNDKTYQRFSGYPSGQKTIRLKELLKKSPEQVMRLAVDRMIPSGALGNQMKKKLKIYAGAEHPHQSQKPMPLEV